VANTTAVIRCVSGSVLQRARAALICLSLGMHQEERKRLKGTKGGPVASMHLDVWEETGNRRRCRARRL